MKRLQTISLALLAAVAVAVSAQPTTPEAAPIAGAEIDRLDDRLAALDPTDPSAYFELGEEAAAEGEDRLATELFALTLAIALETGETRLSAGACIALAGLAGTDRERRWLVAIARGIDERFAAPAWSERVTPRVGAVSERAAETFTFVRAGDGYEARKRLDEDEVRALIERVAGPEWVDRLRTQAEAWPCSECRNRRFVPVRGGSDGGRVCPVCGGNPGEPLRRTELVEHLAVEGGLVGVERRSWAAELLVGGGTPLREPEPSEVAVMLGVDPRERWWRQGAWTSAPAGRP